VVVGGAVVVMVVGGAVVVMVVGELIVFILVISSCSWSCLLLLLTEL